MMCIVSVKLCKLQVKAMSFVKSKKACTDSTKNNTICYLYCYIFSKLEKCPQKGNIYLYAFYMVKTSTWILDCSIIRISSSLKKTTENNIRLFINRLL